VKSEDSNEDLNAARRESKAPTLGKHKHRKSQGLESQNQHKEGGWRGINSWTKLAQGKAFISSN